MTERAVACLSLARSGEMRAFKTQVLLPIDKLLPPCQ